MNDTTMFADMARELGLPKKLLYSVKEVSRVCLECRAPPSTTR